jgi:hypothetical protein
MSEFASREADRRKISARTNIEHEAAAVTTAIRHSTVRRNATVNISRFLLLQKLFLTTNCFGCKYKTSVRSLKTSKFQKIKTPTAAVLPPAALVFHILDIPRSRLASDTENAED